MQFPSFFNFIYAITVRAKRRSFLHNVYSSIMTTFPASFLSFHRLSFFSPASAEQKSRNVSQFSANNAGAPTGGEVLKTKADRFYILDFVRLVAMVMMMQGHTLDALVSPEYLNVGAFPWNVWHFIRGLTAPTFLLISGAVQVFATKRDAEGRISNKMLFKRLSWAFLIIGIGYLLVFPANRIADLPFVTAEGWRTFFQVNILQLSGVTLIATTLLMYFTRSSRNFALISIGLALGILVVAPFAYQVDWFAYLPEGIAAYLSYSHGSLFAILPFSAYMFAGVGVGFLLSEIPQRERESRFPRIAFVLGALFLALGVAGTYSPLTLFPAHNYYLASPHFAFIRVGCVLVAMSALTYIYGFTRSFAEYYSRLGKKSLYIYVVHLVLLFGTPWFKGMAGGAAYRSMTVAEGAVMAAVVLAFSLVSAYIVDYFQRNSQAMRKGIRLSLMGVLLYALLI